MQYASIKHCLRDPCAKRGSTVSASKSGDGVLSHFAHNIHTHLYIHQLNRTLFYKEDIYVSKFGQFLYVHVCESDVFIGNFRLLF